MQKLFNSLLLIIFLGLVVIFVYKTERTPEVLTAKVNQQSSAQNQQLAPNLFNSEEEFNKKIHDYIVQHPEVLVEAMEGMQRKKLEESNKQATDYLAQNKLLVETDGTPPMLGNKDGDVTIVIFYDYSCGFCKQANEFANELLKKDPNVKVILRPIPILGEASVYATKIALAVYKISEEKFPLIHNGLMSMKVVNEAAVKELLAANNIDYSIVENEVSSFSVKQAVNKNFDLARSIGIKGAPSYVINGIFVPGLIDTEKFTTIIGELRQAPVQSNPPELSTNTNSDPENNHKQGSESNNSQKPEPNPKDTNKKDTNK